jgi:Rha family phage regulatory protein
MNTQVTPNYRPYVEVINGQIKTTSLKIAEHFNKRHDNVLDKIKKLDCSPEFSALNFKVAEYTDEQGKKRLAYEMTRDGFTFLAMGFTGKEAAKWKESYINAFNKMAEELHKPRHGLKVLPKQADDLPPEVIAAIDARAMAMSIRHYDKYKSELRKAIQSWAQHLTGDCLVNFVKTIDMKDSHLVIVHRDELWKLTSSLATLGIIQQQSLEAIHDIEASIGQEWYGRGRR